MPRYLVPLQGKLYLSCKEALDMLAELKRWEFPESNLGYGSVIRFEIHFRNGSWIRWRVWDYASSDDVHRGISRCARYLREDVKVYREKRRNL